jgi:hypothetical protein
MFSFLNLNGNALETDFTRETRTKVHFVWLRLLVFRTRERLQTVGVFHRTADPHIAVSTPVECGDFHLQRETHSVADSSKVCLVLIHDERISIAFLIMTQLMFCPIFIVPFKQNVLCKVSMELCPRSSNCALQLRNWHTFDGGFVTRYNIK